MVFSHHWINNTFEILNDIDHDNLPEYNEKIYFPGYWILQSQSHHQSWAPLFKERQKNKDSPHNFNNPPSTMIINNETEINDKQESEDGEKINDERLDLCLGQA